MTDILDAARKDISDRISELKRELKRLESAASALGASATRRGPGRPRGSSSAPRTRGRARTGGRRGRPRGSGTRAAEALALVKAQPGITIPELAEKMGIKQNYLYRVMPTLQQGKQVAKRNKGWHAV